MNTNFAVSKKEFDEAVQVIPGGVNSPVRAFKAVGEHPIFIKQGKGSHIVDVDNNEYIDYVCSWGPLILGHCYEDVVKAISDQLTRGTTFGMPTEIETRMAQLIVDLVPSIEMVRMVSSGTEATMSALRLARGYTHRNKIMKFEGCYHGHSDNLLINAGSGAMTFGVPSSPGIPQDVAKETVVAKYNNIDSVRALFEADPDDIAAVIIEPVAGNMGLVLPEPGFLEELREVTRQYGALLIFDEVISGFRAALGGAQALFGADPDLTCLGKIIGGGLPVGAFGGKKEIMSGISPSGPVYQAGTLSGNPLAMQAGYAALKALRKKKPYAHLDEMGKKLARGLAERAGAHGVDVTINQMGSLLTVFFADHPIKNYDDAKTADTARFGVFFRSMLKQGVHLPPSQFECWFLSDAHTEEDLDKTLDAADRVFAAVSES